MVEVVFARGLELVMYVHVCLLLGDLSALALWFQADSEHHTFLVLKTVFI